MDSICPSCGRFQVYTRTAIRSATTIGFKTSLGMSDASEAPAIAPVKAGIAMTINNFELTFIFRR